MFHFLLGGSLMSVGKLYDLIDNEIFVHHFQALYDLHSLTPIGYESLLRPTLFKNPEILFDKASRTDRFFDLEIRSIRKALKTYDEINKYSTNNNKLLLNVFPSNLTNENFFSDFHEIVNDLSIHPNQIVIEINESEIIQNIDLFHDTILQLQENDYLIALDDDGKGVSTLQAIVELQPDYVKMDRYFAKDLAQSTRKQEMIRAISNFCQNTD